MSLTTLQTASKPIALVLLTLATVLAHRGQSMVLHILGSTCGLLAMALLWDLGAGSVRALRGVRVHLAGHERDLGSALVSWLPALLVVGLGLGLMAPLFTGQMPLSHDHPVHLYKAWHFWDEMLLHGRLRGWSSFWFFGYPAEELYPIGSDLWVVLFRAGTLGLLSWETTYGLSFAAVFAFAGYAVFAFGRDRFGTLAGVVAAILWLVDMGDYREGGWSYTVDWAVWVQIMAMAFFLLSFQALFRVWERGRPADYLRAGLLLCCALLSHQMNVMLLAMSLPLLHLCRWLARGRPIGRELAGSAASLALGAALAGFWLLPMLARSAWTTNIGDLWRPFDTTVKGLMDGTALANNWPMVVLLGLIGAGLGVAMRRATALFLVLLAALLLFISTTTAFEELALATLSEAFGKIQYQRLLIPAKACLYLLAGLALQELWQRVKARRLETPSPETPPAEEAHPHPAKGPEAWRRVLLALLIALLIAPFVRPALSDLKARYLRTIGSLTLKRHVHYWEDYQDFLIWSARKKKESKAFYRISYELDRHNHMMMGAPAFNQTPYYKVGYTPAKLYKHITETTESELYKALSVRYIVSLGPLPRTDVELETQFGSLLVYRFRDFRPERYTLSGPGEVKVEAFDEERIRLRLSGTGPGSRLKLHVSNFPRWRARQNGAILPITEAPVFGTSYPMLMEVPVKDGLLEVDYVMRGVDWLGTLLSVLGLGIVGLLWRVERSESLAERLGSTLKRPALLVVRLGPWLFGALALVAVGAAAHRYTRGRGPAQDEGSLARLLPQAQVTLGDRPCAQWKRTTWGMGWFCSDKGWNYLGDGAERFNGAYLRCIWAHPLDDGPLSVRFPGVRMGTALAGSHGLADGAVEGFPLGAPVTLEVRVGDEVLARLERPNEKGWAGFRVDTTRFAGQTKHVILSISTPQSAGRHYCFDARIER